MIERSDILKECTERCISEMYKWAQPSIDNFWETIKGKESEFSYSHYYLSNENLTFILDHYLEAYKINNWFDESLETLIEFFSKGGYHEIYEGEPPKRKVEKEKPLKDFIGEENAKTVIDLINEYKSIYRFGSVDVGSVKFSIMDISPTSNKNSVIEYWKSVGKEITINDFSVEDKYYGGDEDE